MSKSLFALMLAILYLFLTVDNGYSAPGGKLTIIQVKTAQTAYDKGFAKGVMSEGKDAVKLWQSQSHRK